MGRPSWTCNGQPVPLPEKAYCLAVILALAPGRRVGRARLRDMLWPGSAAEKASNNLRQLLSRIARAQRGCGVDLVEVVGADVVLAGPPLDVDLVDWIGADPEALIQRRDWPALLALLRAHEGRLLADLTTEDGDLDDWVRNEAEAIRSLWTNAASQILDLSPLPMPDAEGLQFAARALALDPTCEAAFRARMRVHAAAGNLVAVQQIYRDCLTVLRTELDVAPSEQTSSLAHALLGQFGAATRQATMLREAVAAPRTAGDLLRPRIAVMLIPGLEPGPIRPYLSALTEDITAGLSRYRSFRTIAAHTSFNVARGAAGDLGGGWCDYAVFTGLRESPRGFSATFRLTRVADDEVIWADEFTIDRHGAAGFFRGVTARVVAAAADAVDRSELELPHPPEDPGAYRMYLEGRRQLRSTDLRYLRRARRWFRRSAVADPRYPGGLAGIARTLTMEWLVRGAPDEDLLEEARRFALDAIEADGRDARGYRELGFASLYDKAFEDSLEQFQQAVALNPNDADLLADQADALAHSGDPIAGLASADTALALNPSPPAYYHWIRGSIYYQLARYQDAIDALAPLRSDPSTARLLAASSAMAGDLKSAAHYAEVVHDTLPDFRTDSLWRIVPNRDPNDTRHLIDGLRLAGLD